MPEELPDAGGGGGGGGGGWRRNNDDEQKEEEEKQGLPQGPLLVSGGLKMVEIIREARIIKMA